MMENAFPDLSELNKRLSKLKTGLVAQGIDAALLVYEADRYWASATMQSGYVLVPAAGEPVLIVRKSAERARIESPLPVIELKTVRMLPEVVAEALGGRPSSLGVTFDILPHTQVMRLKSMFKDVEFKDVSHALALARSVKTAWELERIKCAAGIVAEAVAEVKNFLKPGMTEIELAARVEYEMRRRGHGGFTPMRGFNQRLHYGHVFAGETAAEAGGYDMPTVGRGLSPAVGQGPSSRPIAKGEPVVVDLVGHCDGYLCDQTRMFSMGEPDGKILEAYGAAVKIQEAVASAAMPGIKASDLFDLATQTASSLGLAGHFLGEEHKVTFVGHGIGIEVDEYPFLAKGFDLELEEGMIFALEPKFIFKGVAAVGIEDTYVVEKAGARAITLSPREFSVI